MEKTNTGETSNSASPPEQKVDPKVDPKKAPSKGRRNRARVSARREGNNVKFRMDQNRAHATSEIEKQLEQLSIGATRPPRYIPISLLHLVLIVRIAYERSVYSMNSRARSCRISASEVLMCVMTLAFVKMALLHNKKRPLFGRVTLDDHLIQRASGCVGLLPRPIACWMQNFGFFELDRNACVPVADHTREFTLWPVRNFSFTNLIAKLRDNDSWFGREDELEMYRRVVFQFNPRNEIGLPDLECFQLDDTYEEIQQVRSQMERTAPSPAYCPVSPTMELDPSTSDGRGTKRSRVGEPIDIAQLILPPPPPPPMAPPAPPPLPNPAGPPPPVNWFPSSDVWLRFMIWCENWGPNASVHDLSQLSGSAAQMVHSMGPTDFQVTRCYRTSHDINERLFNIGAAMGYGHMDQTNPPLRTVAARDAASDDCAMYVNAVPVSLVNALM